MFNSDFCSLKFDNFRSDEGYQLKIRMLASQFSKITVLRISLCPRPHWLETRVIIKSLTHPCYPRTFHGFSWDSCQHSYWMLPIEETLMVLARGFWAWPVRAGVAWIKKLTVFIAGNRCTAKDSAWHHAAIRLLVEFAFRRQPTVVGYILIFFLIFFCRVHSFRIGKMNTDRLIMPQHGCIVQMCSDM